jgi:hypothetical protein
MLKTPPPQDKNLIQKVLKTSLTDCILKKIEGYILSTFGAISFFKFLCNNLSRIKNVRKDRLNVNFQIQSGNNFLMLQTQKKVTVCNRFLIFFEK